MISFTFDRVQNSLSAPVTLSVLLSGQAVVDYDYTVTGFDSVTSNLGILTIPAGALTKKIFLTPVPGLTQPDATVIVTIESMSNIEIDPVKASATGTLTFSGGGGGYGYQY